MEDVAMINALPIGGIKSVTDSDLDRRDLSFRTIEGSSVGRQVTPTIYTEYHFDDQKFGFLQYPKEMVERHAALGVTLDRQEISHCWEVEIQRFFPDGHPEQKRLFEQVGLIPIIRYCRQDLLMNLATDTLLYHRRYSGESVPTKAEKKVASKAFVSQSCSVRQYDLLTVGKHEAQIMRAEYAKANKVIKGEQDTQDVKASGIFGPKEIWIGRSRHSFVVNMNADLVATTGQRMEDMALGQADGIYVPVPKEKRRWGQASSEGRQHRLASPGVRP